LWLKNQATLNRKVRKDFTFALTKLFRIGDRRAKVNRKVKKLKKQGSTGRIPVISRQILSIQNLFKTRAIQKLCIKNFNKYRDLTFHKTNIVYLCADCI
jgi:hypothetical protein